MSQSRPQFVDLHCHSTASDGTLPPRDLVRLAQRCELVGLALTDHDTVAGLADAADEAASVGIAFVPGIEISCAYPHPGTMHLLGYGVDRHSPALLAMSQELIAGRNERNPRIIARLNALNVSITLAEVEAEAKGGVISRAHIAAVLVRKGYVSSVHQAFARYLSPGAAAFVDKERLTARQAIGAVKEAGGSAVLAHPVQLKTENDAQLDRVVKDLVDIGLDGIEVIHSDHDAKLIEKYSKVAERYGLIKTGGSDFHGDRKADVSLGKANGHRIPRQFMDALMQAGRNSR